jgi:RNA polymerase sigma factor (sigma-70 family)
MALCRNANSLREIQTLFSVGAAGGLSDAELLDRFAARDGDAAELAFAVLVERHGPMVLRVCRQTLRDEHAAEDAFQAAFLVLARRARTFRVRGSLAPWLHKVALRTASRLRADSAKRSRHEKTAASFRANLASDPICDDLGEVLQEELCRLPARYRVPLVLCYLEGLDSQQAAQQLGWPAGTVRTRLTRGRERLRARLIRRGLVPSAAAVAAALVPRSAWAAVPLNLVSATARNASLTAVGPLTAGIVPASILTLTEGVLFDMALFKLKTAAAALLLTSVLVGSAIVSAQGPGRAPEALPLSNADRSAALEAKLDRLIQALEKRSDAANSAPRGHFEMVPTTPSAGGPRPYVANAPLPGQMTRPVQGEKGAGRPNTATGNLPVGFQLLDQGSEVADSAARGHFDMAPRTASTGRPGNYVANPPPPGQMSGPVQGEKGAGRPNTATGNLPVGFPPRPNGLEQRLADLERRLAELERVVGASQSSHQRSGSTEVDQQ